VADVGGVAKRIIGNVERAIVGKRQQLILALTAWLCEGHGGQQRRTARQPGRG
jgi:MoxR-like ATPase